MSAEDEALLLLDKIQRQLEALALLSREARRVARRCEKP